MTETGHVGKQHLFDVGGGVQINYFMPEAPPDTATSRAIPSWLTSSA